MVLQSEYSQSIKLATLLVNYYLEEDTSNLDQHLKSVLQEIDSFLEMFRSSDFEKDFMSLACLDQQQAYEFIKNVQTKLNQECKLLFFIKFLVTVKKMFLFNRILVFAKGFISKRLNIKTCIVTTNYSINEVTKKDLEKHINSSSEDASINFFYKEASECDIGLRIKLDNFVWIVSLKKDLISIKQSYF